MADQEQPEVRGPSGGVLGMLILALTFGLVGFAAPGWTVETLSSSNFTQEGLWSKYSCVPLEQESTGALPL